jgi:ATP-dependent Clp protease ATP-binding subunit ClpA
VVAFNSLPPEVITKVVEKFVFQLEAQLADRGVTIELGEDATKWLAEKGYDAKFGARPLARVIQETIKKPLAEQLLFGSLINGGVVRIMVEGEGDDSKLAFEYIPVDPAKKPKSPEEEEEEGSAEDGGEALVGATPKKALPGPKNGEGSGRSPGGAVPSIPRRKKED